MHFMKAIQGFYDKKSGEVEDRARKQTQRQSNAFVSGSWFVTAGIQKSPGLW